MNRSLIANRYAKALFKLALEKDILEEVNDNIILLQSYCDEAEGFMELLNSPVIKPGQKSAALHSVFEKKLNVITVNFLDLLIDNKREVLLEDINRGFTTLYKQSQGIKSVSLHTAVKIEKDQGEAILNFLKEQLNAPIELKLKVVPELLGGFKLMVDGKMADASLSSKLKNVKKQLLS